MTRDRTGDFQLAIRSLQPQQSNGALPDNNNIKGLTNARSKFMSVANQVSKDLANTLVKLEKLTLLAQRKSLFDDKSDEIHKLTMIIKQDIEQLKHQVSQLEQLGKSQTNHMDHSKQSHTRSVVCTLQSHLAKMSKNFKDVLEKRTKNMKNQKARRDQYSSSNTALGFPESSTNGKTSSFLLQDEFVQSQQNGHLNSGHTLVDMGEESMMSRQLAIVQEQDNYIQSRVNVMTDIEQTIVELGTIFQQLAHMVQEQEEVVLRIDSNLEETSLNVEAAHSELVRYFQSVTSNRWLMVKVFGILIIFFIIFIVFVA